MNDKKTGLSIEQIEQQKKEEEMLYDKMSLYEQWKWCKKQEGPALKPCNVQFFFLFLRVFIVIIILFILWQKFS